MEGDEPLEGDVPIVDDRVGTYRLSFDPASVSPSEAIRTAVGEVLGVEPGELPPLQDAIDPIVLDALFRERGEYGSPVGEVRFPYHEFDVTVRAEGVVELRRPDLAPDSRDAFATALQQLLVGAARQGVDTLGGFECRTGDGGQAWNVEISALTPDPSRER